jgi:DNA-binding GntR family transcriptional regulator
VSGSDEDVLRFVAASFPSVWALELLLTLKSERRVWTRDELVTGLRASELVVSKALDALVAAGLISIESGGGRYLPVNQDVADCVDRVERRLYRSRANTVRRAIVSAQTSSATAFADAFKLRRDGDD